MASIPRPKEGLSKRLEEGSLEENGALRTRRKISQGLPEHVFQHKSKDEIGRVTF